MFTRADPIELRLWSRVVEAPSGCWEYQGPRQPKGYGTLWFEGAKRTTHRVVWTITHGPIPPGLCVMHLCDNPPCCNPAHLRLGTVAENQADKAMKGRARNQNARKTSCPKGHRYTEANTYTQPSGKRECRTCRAARRIQNGSAA